MEQQRVKGGKEPNGDVWRWEQASLTQDQGDREEKIDAVAIIKAVDEVTTGNTALL